MIVSKPRAARRRRERYAARGMADPARLYELNCQRRLPKDHSSADRYDGTDSAGVNVWGDTDEEGVRRREPIITTPAQARRMCQHVGLSGVCRHIDQVLRAHPGSQPVLTTQMILTLMLLTVKMTGKYKRTAFCEVLAGLDAAISIEWGLLDPDTGNSLVSYNLVWRQARRIEAFLTDGAVTPGGVDIDLQWMVDRFLAPSVAKWSARAATEIAIDATRIPPGTVLKPNGKIQRTDDVDAGQGFRSETSKRPAGHFNGYFAHLAVLVRSIRKGRRHHSVAPHIVAMTLTPADEEAGPIGHEVAIQAKRVAPKLKVVKADQHYTRKKDTFVRPLREQGWEIVMNQSSDEQKRVRLITAGTRNTPILVHCGTPLVVWTPQHLLTQPDDLTGVALQDWYNERDKYQWVVIQHFKNGTKKLICPQCAGRVKTTAKTRNPNRPNRTHNPDQPTVAVPDTEYCCNGMITLSIEQLDNHQRNAYGTTNWATDYAGRNPVEGVNSMIKDDGSFDKASCRAFGLAAHTLAALMAAVIHNLEQTRRTRNRDNHNSIPTDPDQTPPDTTPTPHQPHTHPGTPINQPRPIPHRRNPPVEPNASKTSRQHHQHP